MSTAEEFNTEEFYVEVRRAQAERGDAVTASDGVHASAVAVRARALHGELLAREPVAPAYLTLIGEEALWHARRQGAVSDNAIAHDAAHASWDLEPVFAAPGHDQPAMQNATAGTLQAINVRIGESPAAHGPLAAGADAHRLTRRFSINCLEEPAMDLVRRLRKDGVLGPDEPYELRFLAQRAGQSPAPWPARQPSTAKDAAAPGARFQVIQKRLPPTAVPGRIASWSAHSTPINDVDANDKDTPVFISAETLSRARDYCRRPGVAEGGAALVGQLVRQWDPTPELFVVIDGCFEIRHAEQTQFSLAPSTATYALIEAQLAQRRKRLGRPHELLLGIAHGHNFLPALDPDGHAICPRCPKRPTCPLHSAHYSLDDVRFHQALFQRLVCAVGLVWGFSPREEDVLRVYGFRDGALRQRAIHRIAHPQPQQPPGGEP